MQWRRIADGWVGDSVGRAVGVDVFNVYARERWWKIIDCEST